MRYTMVLCGMILAACAAVSCPKEDRRGDIMETDSVRSGPEIPSPDFPLANLGNGTYALELVLSAREPFSYRLRIKGRDAPVAETEAVLSVRPLRFYCDEGHFVLPVEPSPEDAVGPDQVVNGVFLVFRPADGKFRRYGIRESDAGSFGVAGGKLYVGSHHMESPNGSVAVVDLGSGETADIDLLKDGDGLTAIETWCPVVGLDAGGRVKIRLNDFDGRLYGIEGDRLVSAGEGELTPFENPELPIR